MSGKYTESFDDWICESWENCKCCSHVDDKGEGSFIHQQSKINELLEENKKLKDLFDGNPTHWSNVIFDKNKELDRLEERLKECEESLRFYADEKNQIPPEYYDTGRPQADFTAPYRIDGGKRAREYFKKYEGLNDNK